MNRWPRPEPQSALVVLVPEAEPLVAGLRAAHDPAAAAGVPAHITILFPFAPPAQIDDDAIDRLRAIFGAHRSFEYRLVGIGGFPGLVYLAPDPEDPFRALTLALQEDFPDYPPYEGRHPVVVPHLTVGTSADEGALERIARDLASSAEGVLPIPARATGIALMDNTPGPWRVVTMFPLGRS